MKQLRFGSINENQSGLKELQRHRDNRLLAIPHARGFAFAVFIGYHEWTGAEFKHLKSQQIRKPNRYVDPRVFVVNAGMCFNGRGSMGLFDNIISLLVMFGFGAILVVGFGIAMHLSREKEKRREQKSRSPDQSKE